MESQQFKYNRGDLVQVIEVTKKNPEGLVLDRVYEVIGASLTLGAATGIQHEIYALRDNSTKKVTYSIDRFKKVGKAPDEEVLVVIDDPHTGSISLPAEQTGKFPSNPTSVQDILDLDSTAGRTLLHKQICEYLTNLYERKNTDYGDSFHKTFVEEGFAMSRIRLSDKLERFKALSKAKDQLVKDESIEDTLTDLANYAIMTLIEIRREK